MKRANFLKMAVFEVFLRCNEETMCFGKVVCLSFLQLFYLHFV